MPPRRCLTRLRHLGSLACAGVLAAGLGPLSAAGAVEVGATDLPGPVTGTDLPITSPQAAEQALAAVQDVLSDPPLGAAEPERTDLTLLLRDLRLGLRSLAPEERTEALGLLARPTDSNDEFAYSRPDRALNTCEVAPVQGAEVCVHWEPSGTHAPSRVDEDRDDVPDFVETARDELLLVFDRVVTRGGYRAPLADGRGPDDRLDVYLADIGQDGLYGFCTPERRARGLSYSGYCVLDNDYSSRQFPNLDPLDNLRVTAAHEFFHAAQFAYDSAEDSWFMEGTAAWIEDEIYDDVNDNRSFIPGGHLTDPRLPLDALGRQVSDFYHSWTWWRFLSELEPETAGSGLPVIIRRAWEGADATNPALDRDSLRATLGAVRASGRGLTGVLAAYGEAKRHPDDAFEEGASWPTTPLVGTQEVARGERTPATTATLRHLTSQTYAFEPGPGTRSRSWRLRVAVDAPDIGRGSRAHVSVLHVDGRRVIRQVKLDRRRRQGQIVTQISSQRVQRVELTLTNGGRRYRCWEGTYLACRGVPLDDGRRMTFAATSFRP